MRLHANQMGKYLHCEGPAKKHRKGREGFANSSVSGVGLWRGILEGVVQAF